MKFFAFQVTAACLLVLSGCASTQEANTAAVAAPKDESCRVTGSNLPKRECRGDATVLPPSAVESVKPVLSGAGVRP